MKKQVIRGISTVVDYVITTTGNKINAVNFAQFVEGNVALFIMDCEKTSPWQEIGAMIIDDGSIVVFGTIPKIKKIDDMELKTLDFMGWEIDFKIKKGDFKISLLEGKSAKSHDYGLSLNSEAALTNDPRGKNISGTKFAEVKTVSEDELEQGKYYLISYVGQFKRVSEEKEIKIIFEKI